MSMFQSASVISLFIGPPIGGLLMYMDGIAGLHGWQWLYIVEGLPPIITGFITYKLLTDRPKDAMWLTPEQRTWLQERLDSEHAAKEAIRKYSLRDSFCDKKIWLLTLAYFGQNVSGYGLVFFLPLIVKGLGVSQDWVGVVSALPYLCSFVVMILLGYHSDLTGERTWPRGVRLHALRCRVGGLHLHQRPVHHDGGDLHRGVGPEEHRAAVLVDSQRHAHGRRCGIGSRDDQCDRQSRRLAGTDRLWHREGCHRQFEPRAAVPRGGAGGHRAVHDRGRPRSPAGRHPAALAAGFRARDGRAFARPAVCVLIAPRYLPRP